MLLRYCSLIVLTVLALSGPALATVVEGRARVVDGDTVVIGSTKVRLFGVDAPELAQTCDLDGAAWACGQHARQMLADLIGRAHLRCDVRDKDRYGRLVATCLAQGRDIAAELVRQGGALAYRRYSDRYVPAEEAARREGLGVWAARMQTPEDYRHAGRPAPQAAPEAACAIKGNIGPSGPVYHLPGQVDYAATRITESKGEQWFCSEAEAQAQGFRKARR
ncbi:MAG: hypothetical protein RIT14_2436 [Pseudomonadota bacterium]